MHVYPSKINDNKLCKGQAILEFNKTTELPEVTDKLYHTMVYLVQLMITMSGIRTHNFSGDMH
jgi:hypothetical protein